MRLSSVPCPDCDGDGTTIPPGMSEYEADERDYRICEKCDGRGELPDDDEPVAETVAAIRGVAQMVALTDGVEAAGEFWKKMKGY